jgi:calcium/proton exchanger cax
VILLIATAIASITTELAVDAIPTLVDSWNISHVFLGFIVLPFVGNAAEHVTAAKMALRNRMVLAKNVAVESATQVVLFITPAIVLIGWLRGRNMTLQFDHFEMGCILLTGLVVSIAICRGDSGWKQGLVLHTIYLTVAMGAVIYRGNS